MSRECTCETTYCQHDCFCDECDAGLLKAAKSLIDQSCRMAALIPLSSAQKVLDEMNRMEVLMPFTDPTGYIAISKNLGENKRAVKAFLAFRKELETLKAEIGR